MSSEMDQVFALLQAYVETNQDPTPASMRETYDKTGLDMPMAPGLAVEDITLDGVPTEKLTVEASDTGKAILYLHGGGYSIGSPKSHRALASQLAHAAKATTFVPDYGLAPEKPHPSAVQDATLAFKALLDRNYASDDIVVMGDSAGGGLAIALCLNLKAAGLPQPAAIACLSPWVNLENEGASYGLKAASDPMVTKDGLDVMALAYAGHQPMTAPLISPIHGDLSGLPPLLIQVGSEEVLLSDSTRLAEVAGAVGVPVSLEVWPGMIHVFHFFHGQLTPAREAISRLGAFARAHFG